MPDKYVDPDKDKSEAQKVRDLWQRAIHYWQPYRDARAQERRFLSGDRYEEDEGPYNRDRRRIQIRGQEIQDTCRHVVAKLTEKQRSVEARAQDKIDDADVGEVAASLVSWDLDDPQKGFNRHRYAALMDACEARAGIVWMDWIPAGTPGVSPWGDTMYSYGDLSRFMWEPGFHPHDYLCGWMIREYRDYPERLNRRYGVDWIQADGDVAKQQSNRSNLPVVRAVDGLRLPDVGTYDDRKATIWECWYKNDITPGQYGDAQDTKALPKEDRFMVCEQCGYKTPTQGQLRTEDKVQEELPDILEGGCTTCGGTLERIDAIDEGPQLRAFKNGKRLVAIAPFCTSPEDAPAYDGPWPISSARSFPMYFTALAVKPGAPMGNSFTSIMWDPQLASDELQTQAVQRVLEHRNYWEMPLDGIYNYRRERFGFRDDDFNVMYKDHSQQFQGEVTLHQGVGLDYAGFNSVYNAIQGTLTRYRPVADFGPAEANTRDIAVGTTQALVKEAETQTADFRRRDNLELGMFYGIVYDYQRATLSPERVVRLRFDGLDLITNLDGDAMPGFDFVIDESPEFTGLDQNRASAAQMLISVAQDPMQKPFMDIIAEVNQFPPSIVRRVQKRVEQMEEDARKAASQIDQAPLDQPLDQQTLMGGAPNPGPSGGGNGAAPVGVGA